MEVRAIARYVRVQPRKVRIIAEKVKSKPALYGASLLNFHPSKGASVLRKVLLSAVANAEENYGLRSESLRISKISVDEGPQTKRIQARAMGRANRILKRTSHITVYVEDYEPEEIVKQHGTKAKLRPSFSKKGAKSKKVGAKSETKSDSAPEEQIVNTTENMENLPEGELPSEEHPENS